MKLDELMGVISDFQPMVFEYENRILHGDAGSIGHCLREYFLAQRVESVEVVDGVLKVRVFN